MKLNQWVALVIAGGAVVLYYLVGGNAMMCLLVSTTLLVYAIIKRGGLENRVTKFFSGISMEIYLSHMVIFRVVEKLKLNLILGNGVCCCDAEDY